MPEGLVHADLDRLWEEPYAGKPHVRICEGESRMAELLDRVLQLRPLPASPTLQTEAICHSMAFRA